MIRRVVRRGQERVVEIRRLGGTESRHDRGLISGSIRKSSGAESRWNVRGLGSKGERLYIFVLYEMPDVATSVLGVYNVLQLLLIAAADPEEDGQSDDGDATDTSHHTTNDRTDDGGRVGPSSKADLIVLGTVGVPNLDDAESDQ
jgi:hypothetical protein